MNLPSSILKATLATAFLAAAGALGTAQIERLSLESMVAKTDDSLIGTITKKEVVRIDHPVDGPELYYTHLTVEGRSLVDGETRTTIVTYPGGFIDEENGVWNSEAPTDEETRIGKRVVVFHKWSENMGGDLKGHALYAAHGGLYRTVENQQGVVVLGRGEGYAVSNNVQLSGLDASITRIDAELREAQRRNK